MKHLTLTGYKAGRPYCGAIRNSKDNYCHLPYSCDALEFGEKHISCTACLKILKEVYNEG